MAFHDPRTAHHPSYRKVAERRAADAQLHVADALRDSPRRGQFRGSIARLHAPLSKAALRPVERPARDTSKTGTAVKQHYQTIDAAVTALGCRTRIGVRTTNLAERSFVEERRRTKVIGRFGDEHAAMKLVYAAMTVCGSASSTRRGCGSRDIACSERSSGSCLGL
jgi:hypothetical protein